MMAGVADSPDREQIEKRAYEIYEARGCEDGHAVEDWLAAEQELTTRSESSSRPSSSEPGSRIRTAVAQAMQRSNAAGSNR
jgi:Protein of unknown function (DUF2934)